MFPAPPTGALHRSDPTAAKAGSLGDGQAAGENETPLAGLAACRPRPTAFRNGSRRLTGPAAAVLSRSKAQGGTDRKPGRERPDHLRHRGAIASRRRRAASVAVAVARYVGAVLEELADDAAVWNSDETGFPKKGTKSVGVKRQYSGTLGRTDNCQVAVFGDYCSTRGQTFMDRRLFLPEEGLAGPRERLLVRRSLGQEPELKYDRANAPAEVPLLKLAQVRATRWTIEENIESGKGECGLDEYEARGWAGWHPHTALSVTALAFLVLQRARTREKGVATAQCPRCSLLVHLEVRMWDVAEILRWSELRRERNRWPLATASDGWLNYAGAACEVEQANLRCNPNCIL